MAGARSACLEELADELPPLRVLPVDRLCRHQGPDIRLQLLVRLEQDPPSAALHFDSLETRWMIGLGCDAHQRVGGQCTGFPVVLASADQPVGKHDWPHLARYDVPPVNRLRTSLVKIDGGEQDLIAPGPPLDICEVSVAA